MRATSSFIATATSTTHSHSERWPTTQRTSTISFRLSNASSPRQRTALWKMVLPRPNESWSYESLANEICC